MNQDRLVVFYRSINGKNSVLEEIEHFGVKESLKIFKVIELLRLYGTNLSSERVKQITGKIWELNIDRYRVFYFLYENQQFILIRAFLKKTNKTPIKEIHIAEKRYLDYVSRTEGE